MATPQMDYSKWTQENLIKRVTELEQQLRVQAIKIEKSALPAPPPRKKARAHREFDPSKYSTRLIALKFAYLGQRYNGFEHHANNDTPLPTIEEELWKALTKARLIFPTNTSSTKPGEVSWEGCEYSKCGRTDKGVSAFGQVIGIRVRSNRPLSRPKPTEDEPMQDAEGSTTTEEPAKDDTPPFDPINDELPYAQVLNRLLPEDIRILAWCPSPPPDFSARFSCRERRYRYFFTQPAFSPIPGANGVSTTSDRTPRRDGWLDIEAMREGARHFMGLHDFRNFCKVDPSKQITNFQRRIAFADIEEINPANGPVGYVGHPAFGPSNSASQNFQTSTESSASSSVSTPRVYTFTIHGSAFLWHQVRHMTAILFLIGQGLESPSIIPKLLDIEQTPTKPMYEMASDAPLVLWDCVFPEADGEGDSQTPSHNGAQDALTWIYTGDTRGTENGKSLGPNRSSDGKFGLGGVVDDMWRVWRRRKIDEVLAGTLLDVMVTQGNTGINRQVGDETVSSTSAAVASNKPKSQRVFDGGNSAVLKGVYVPVMQKPRQEPVDVINARYAARKGLNTSIKEQLRSEAEDDVNE
ncbi:pseudouridine synthase [Xylona heveae TC161]|uniref:Pseudouridine synthase n=1 Tax=Xylona heveae (strain CBS 132557 / TC161) TaxID=1328760 RepID=A0A161TGI7_XYLHT|nr:pseudouridine synthase [Xylona heveae TC161]KZF25277.1 pseudouridine synthase [Xylona heveae TC161]